MSVPEILQGGHHTREKSILYPFKSDPVRVNALGTLADVADVRHWVSWEKGEKDSVRLDERTETHYYRLIRIVLQRGKESTNVTKKQNQVDTNNFFSF